MTEFIRRRHSFFIDFNDADGVDKFQFGLNKAEITHFSSKREDRIIIPFPFTKADPKVGERA